MTGKSRLFARVSVPESTKKRFAAKIKSMAMKRLFSLCSQYAQ